MRFRISCRRAETRKTPAIIFAGYVTSSGTSLTERNFVLASDRIDLVTARPAGSSAFLPYIMLAVTPPSTKTSWPETKSLAGEARNTAVPAISSGWA